MLRLQNRIIDWALVGGTLAFILFLYVPILTLVLFSFADSRVLTFPIEGMTLHWYAQLFQNPNFYNALKSSLILALITMILSTILGTGSALAWMRLNFPFKRALQALSFLPILFPQLLLGVMMLLWFSVLRNFIAVPMGMITLVIGHVIYATPFVLVVVSVQVHGFDAAIEDAARDAGASEWQVLTRITLPILRPAIVAGMILAFLLSWGNFYLSYSLNGSSQTLPIFIFSGIAVGSSPIYPAIATLNFLAALVLVVIAEKMRRKATRRLAGTES
ncbi:MAG: ABC transporter permease [Rhizobiales bacterium]|nr:ABC transporter permease [Hyphomicrobiales bacterium]